MAKIPARKQVNKKYTWNAESVFKSTKDWEAALKAAIDDIPNVKKFEGKLGTSPETLLEGIKAIEDISLRMQTIYMYAQFAYAVDTTNQVAAGMVGRASGPRQISHRDTEAQRAEVHWRRCAPQV